MSCPILTYELTESEFEALVARAKESRLLLNGETSGTTSLHGCTFAWAYGAEVLSITCTAKPFWVSCDTINEALDGLLKP